MTREVPVTQARADLADLVSRVGYTGERILLTRHGKPLAALVPVDDLEELERPPAEIGFSIAPSAEREADESARPQRTGGPMRVAAEHREPRRPGWRR
jgi:prevent-host-death family protein